jgi:hypothetical protein
MMDKIQPYLEEMSRGYHEEIEQAVIDLLSITGIEYDKDNVAELKENLKREGYMIHLINDKKTVFETFVILSHNKNYVAGSIIQLNFELNNIKRTMIPHDSLIEEKFSKMIKGGV